MQFYYNFTLYFVILKIIYSSQIYKIDTHENDTFVASVNVKLEEGKENEIKFEFYGSKISEFFVEKVALENTEEKDSASVFIYTNSEWISGNYRI